MDIQSLRNFQVVANVGSVTYAAEILHFSQPNLSMNIKRLESEVGVQLFDRVKTRLVLSEAGKAFLSYVDDALRSIDKGIESAQAIASAPQKMISIAACDSSWLIPISQKYSQLHPSQSIRTMVTDSTMIIPSILKGEISFAIGPYAPCPELVEWTPFYTEHLGLLVSVKHRFAQLPVVPIEELRGEHFILNIHLFTKEYVKSIFSGCSFTPDIVCECNDNPIIGPMIEANFGISLVDLNAKEAFANKNPSAHVVLVPLDRTIEREIGVFHLRQKDLPISISDLTNATFSYFSDFSE